MGWHTEPDNYECMVCKHEFEFTFDTLFIASHGGLPVTCPECKSVNVQRKANDEMKE